MDTSPGQFGSEASCSLLGFGQRPGLRDRFQLAVFSNVQTAEGKDFIDVVPEVAELLRSTNESSRVHRYLNKSTHVIAAVVRLLPGSQCEQDPLPLRIAALFCSDPHSRGAPTSTPLTASK